jgi:pimeloyl-ACP methyl ester carboxylesterase
LSTDQNRRPVLAESNRNIMRRGFVEAGLDRAGIANGRESLAKALHRRSGYRLDDFRPIEDTRAVTVPTLVAQVHDDFTMPPSYVQEIYDNISAEDKKLFWIEGTDLRFQGYNYFGEHPELVLEWFDTHMS